MTYIIKYTILLHLLLFSSNALAQDAGQCLHIAKQLHQMGEYEEAIQLYRRVLYFNEDMASTSYFHIGESYMAIKDHKQARYYFALAENETSNDSIKLEIWFRKIASYLLDDKAIYARNELLSYTEGSHPYFDRKWLFYQAITAFKLEEIALAHQYFAQIFSPSEQDQLSQLIVQGQKILNKKPYRALAFSAILPGSGQAYAGEWMEGANSFFLNLVTTTLYFYVWNQYSYMDAFIAIMPWWHRYYVGGFMNARDLVLDKQVDNLNVILTDILLLYSLMDVD